MATIKVSSFVVYQYSIPWAWLGHIQSPFPKRREGLILQLNSSQDHQGFGEITPLPGFSRENLASVKKQIFSVKKDFVDKKIPKNLEELSRCFSDRFGKLSLHPSVQFGLETALLNLSANIQGKLFCELISDLHRDSITINALLDGSHQDVCRLARKKIKQGFHSLKLKVGRGPLSQDIKKVQALEKILGTSASLRLDANQRWDWETAVNFGKKIDRHVIDYIEEPLKDCWRLSNFYRETGIPFAFDESLLNKRLEKLRKQKGLKAIILKPTLLGGIIRTMSFMRQAESFGVQPIISSSFETDIGLTALSGLAACARDDLPVGLDTRQWFNYE